jgi:uncharacterized protein (DUF4415 family)/uncharacterized DUF497 family protein
MELEWDASKAELNLQNHGISFEDAALVFYDHGRIESYDGREDYGEDRLGSLFGRSCTWSTPFEKRKPSALFRHERQSPMSKINTVKRTLDLTKPPIVTDEQKVRLAMLDAMPDDQIDTSDAPFRPDAVWVKAVDFPHAKKLISLRIDEDVIEFFKQTGTRYQTRINAVLRSYVNAHQNVK